MNLACKQCGHENETQRVYCHNCGSKLDRSVLPEDKKKKDDTPAAVRQRIRKFGEPGRLTVGKVLRQIFSAVLFGFCAAAIICIVLPPRDLPKEAKETVDAPVIAFDLDDAVNSGRPVGYREKQINASLKRSIQAAKKAKGGASYAGTFVHFKPEGVWTSMGFSIFDYYTLYVTTAYHPEIKGGRVTGTNLGGSIGRLPIPSQAMKYLTAPFGQLWDALKRERDYVGRMKEIRLQENGIIFVPYPPGTAPATPPVQPAPSSAP